MAKKSILLIGSYPPPFGGVPRHLEELAPVLVDRGWDVHILATGHSGVEVHSGFTVYKEGRPRKALRVATSIAKGDWGTTAQFLIEGGVANRAQFLAWASLGRSIMRTQPVQLVSVYNLLRLPVGLVLGEEFDVPLVISNFGEAYSHQGVLTQRIDVVRRASERAAKLISMSRHCADSYRALGLAPDVSVYPYGIDVKRFTPSVDASQLRRALAIAPTDTVVLFVGRMVSDMGLHTLLEAMPTVLRSATAVKFLLVGGRGDLYPAVERMVAMNPDTVIAIPDAPAEDLPFLYAVADLVVAPTQGERACGSLAALEAMASGKPVIGARAGGVPEIVIDGETGRLVPPNDSAALARSITALLAQPDQRAILGANGRQRALSHFDGQALNARIERLFSEVANSSRR